jgi:hypothetical protein
MPNYDAGHYFLTVLAPIRLDSILINDQSHSRRHMIREALAYLPTSESTYVSEGKGTNSPFAGNTTTHFARFVVIDDVVFNGRVSCDAILSTILGVDPMEAQPVDQLARPFLLFVADFDAASGDDGELKSYLATLWSTMSDKLTGIFTHCNRFEGVKTADDFFNYIKNCQLETTMPFNDYWSVALELPRLSWQSYVIGAGILAALAVLARWGGFIAVSWWWIAAFIVLDVIVMVALLYRKVMTMGELPFPKSPPPAPSSDLPTILKALYLQRGFTDFVTRNQGASDLALHAAFGDFITDCAPNVITNPTQPPGVIG